MQRRDVLLAAATMAVLFSPLFASSSATAADDPANWPTRPIKFIVPFPPGGTSDVMARMVAAPLTKELGQPVVVDNMGGAGGTIGAARGAKATPDGYTIVMSGVGQDAVAHGLNPKLSYDSMKDFIHISQIHSGPNVLVAHPASPFKTFAEFLDYARKNPGKLNYGFTPAASGHMAMELLRQVGGVCTNDGKDCKQLDMVGVPYKGGGPMLTDLLGNQIPIMFINQDAALQYVKAGKMVALAVTSAERNPLYPDVPTIAEGGLKGYEAMSWSGVSVPAGTPKPIVDKIEAAMKSIMASAEIRERMERVGFVIPVQGSAAYTKQVASEIELWTRVIKNAGIKIE